MNDFGSWFVKRFFERMLWRGIGVLIVGIYLLIRGVPYVGIPFLILGVICVVGGLIYKMVHKNR